MPQTIELAFQQAPNTNVLLAKALWPRPRALKQDQGIPAITARLEPRVAPASHVSAYRALCGFAADGTLPVTYPHVLAAPLHLAMLTHPSFPLRLLGAVHVRNTITQHRALASTDELAITVATAGHTQVEQGVEVNITTHAHVKDALVWEGLTTMLIRSGTARSGGGKAFTPPDLSAFSAVADIRAPQDMGRRYGVVAGDLNPIHLHPLTARAFGFPRTIAHGMWTFARCVAELTRATVPAACTLEVAFKRPLLLPSTAHLVAHTQGNRTDFVAHDAGVKTLFLTGALTR